MLQVALRLVQRLFPQVILPLTITIGFIGYSMENYFRPQLRVNELPSSKSVSELRQERQLEGVQDSLNDRTKD